MKLQRQLSRRVKDKEYPKYVVTIPPKLIEELGWKEGMELEYDTQKNGIILKPKVKTEKP